VAPATRFLAGPTEADDEVLARVHGPVLDIGCGPGRHVAALAERGTIALGIDITPAALLLARRRGASVLERSVFARVPGAGRWATALLLDGNLGIGADPTALLQRVFELLRAGGEIVVETGPTGSVAASGDVQFEVGGVAGPWFAWSVVDGDDLPAIAAGVGCGIVDSWRRGSRAFAVLRRD
jgi:SAM-dependent methyltransferase